MLKPPAYRQEKLNPANPQLMHMLKIPKSNNL